MATAKKAAIPLQIKAKKAASKKAVVASKQKKSAQSPEKPFNMVFDANMFIILAVDGVSKNTLPRLMTLLIAKLPRPVLTTVLNQVVKRLGETAK